MAGMPEVQELKRAAELRSQLRTVSEAGPGASGAEQGAEVQPGSPRSPELRPFCLQLAEVLSLFSHNVTEKQTSLSSLSSELAKSRDQVHEDRRSVGFPFLGGAGGARSSGSRFGSSLLSPSPWQ